MKYCTSCDRFYRNRRKICPSCRESLLYLSKQSDPTEPEFTLLAKLPPSSSLARFLRREKAEPLPDSVPASFPLLRVYRIITVIICVLISLLFLLAEQSRVFFELSRFSELRSYMPLFSLTPWVIALPFHLLLWLLIERPLKKAAIPVPSRALRICRTLSGLLTALLGIACVLLYAVLFASYFHDTYRYMKFL